MLPHFKKLFINENLSHSNKTQKTTSKYIKVVYIFLKHDSLLFSEYCEHNIDVKIEERYTLWIYCVLFLVFQATSRFPRTGERGRSRDQSFMTRKVGNLTLETYAK